MHLHQFEHSHEIDDLPESVVEYSFCTLMTDETKYRAMVKSFLEVGFTLDRCEFIFSDNRFGNKLDAYRGLNRMIAAARGRYVILVHQDVLAADTIKQLNGALAQLSDSAPNWAVAGNAGYDRQGKHYHTRISDRHLIDAKLASGAQEVASLDENFLVLRRDALLGFSDDISGFHLYGTDLVLQANFRGRTAWVVDFHVEHLGCGLVDNSFLAVLQLMEAKYARILAGRIVRTPVTWIGIGMQTWRTRRAKHKIKTHVYGGWRKSLSIGFSSFRSTLRALSDRRLLREKYALDGLLFTIPDNATRAARKAMQNGLYEKHERDLIAKWVSSDIPAVELGASYGIVSTFLRRKISEDRKVVVVEANPALMPFCSGNVAALASKGETIFVNKALAYGESRSVPFKVTAGVHDSHIATSGEDDVIMVPTTTLTSLLADHKIEGQYSLVCDIEGYEFDLLEQEGGVLENCAMLIVEAHPAIFYGQNRSFGAFRRMVLAAGFEIVETSGTVIAARRVHEALVTPH